MSTTTISIRTDETGRIITRYIGAKDGDQWTQAEKSKWPEDESGPDEIPRYYYDPKTDEITVQYETVTSDSVQ